MAPVIVEIIDVQEFSGQQVLNVFHFIDADGVASEAVLVDDYINDVLPLVTGVQSDVVNHVAIRHRQVYPLAKLVQERSVSPAVGGQGHSQVAMPSAVALSVKFVPGDTTVLSGGFTGHLKRSGCRLAGLTEVNVNANSISAAAIAGVEAWFAEIKDPGTDPWQLCVVSFLSGNSKPRAHSATATAWAPILSQSSPGVSTQNTRKVLRGHTY